MQHTQYIRKISNSNTAVLFIHGIIGSPNHFNKFVSSVSKNFSIYNILLDGHGRCVSDISHSSMNKWKKQIANIVDSLIAEYENIIIVAHSMGTLFAIEEGIKHPKQIKHLFLLSLPLKVFIKPYAFLYSIRIIFGIWDKSPKIADVKKAFGVKPSKKIWQYIGWIPRYIELFKEIALIRTQMKILCVPCTVFLFKKDELVSLKTVKYLKDNELIKTYVLKDSGHFYYTDTELYYLLSKFNEINNKF